MLSVPKRPNRIISSLHPHPLTLQQGKAFCCHACLRGYSVVRDGYCCKDCRFNLDLKCANIRLASYELTKGRLTIKKEEEEEEEEEEEGVEYFSHRHPLQLYKKIPNDRIKCCLCRTYCSDHAYCCFECSFFLHPSCFTRKLPREICYPFHPVHSLTLQDKVVAKKWWRNRYDICNACGKDSIRYLIYACDQCSFCLHIDCSDEITHAIKFEGHPHLIFFRDNIEKKKLKCSSCKFHICESYGFTCLYCDLNLHLTCGPLPYTITHKCHINPLVLTNSPVQEEEEEEEEERNKFYCNACDEERDPQLPVYYSAKSRFVAEIKCVFSKVISLLKGEYEDVKLCNVLGLSGKLISRNTEKEMLQNIFEQLKLKSTLSRFFESSSQDVIKELSCVFMAMKTLTTEEDDHYQESRYLEDLLLPDMAYTQFMKFLDRGRGIHEPLETLEEVVNVGAYMVSQVVNVGDYMVPMRLAPILKHLLSKHKDISAKSTLSPIAKLYLINILCECIYSMSNTRVVDITKDLLLKWWTIFKMLQFATFEIQFAFDHLKRVAHAYFGLYVKKQVDNALNNIDRDLAKLHKDIEALEKKRGYIKSGKSAKSSIIEECLREASVMKHSRASSGLLRILP